MSNEIETDKEKKVTRKSSPPIKVYCLPEEKLRIEAQAERAGMSAARYLREVGQGYQIKGVVDFEQVRELARINGDLGRLGGLLKLWLTDDVRTAQFGQSTILAVLSKIEATQEEMGKVMTKVVMPRSES
ncbi:conjugal transfer transcriptional regulator TraJ [Cycloclasticus zancles]|uniref:Conjugal transfer protein TraJ n=1 Tax=Cycloclasticus zancles 78-ME TaxID=1198232 RepID=S5U131_9GAMM|nr:conjugal transfer transcriptional regulator TraJ [Cycloclasticus zancles]AGS40913.1 Conjugal transfer protein TraJ [Cycloclasticus zancles 78-ME]